MPSKKSKTQNNPFLWKQESSCSEDQLAEIAQKLASELQPGDRVFLEGPMGVGKTTLGRFLLQALGVIQPPEGSPSFAIAHEYFSEKKGEIVHIDFYRIRSEAEIEEAGIPSYFWERKSIVLSEWLSDWPDFYTQVLKSGRCWKVELEFSAENSARSVKIERFTP